VKIEYTIPGWGLAAAASAEAAPAEKTSFRQVLQQKAVTAASEWRHILRVDSGVGTAPVVSPPPKPPGLEGETVAQTRAALRGLLMTAEPSTEPEAGLLDLLRQRLNLEQSLLARAEGPRR
jgi:hypothetical protein